MLLIAKSSPFFLISFPSLLCDDVKIRYVWESIFWYIGGPFQWQHMLTQHPIWWNTWKLDLIWMVVDFKCIFVVFFKMTYFVEAWDGTMFCYLYESILWLKIKFYTLKVRKSKRWYCNAFICHNVHKIESISNSVNIFYQEGSNTCSW